MTTKKRVISLIAASVLFTACGGGGGGTPIVKKPSAGTPKFISPSEYSVVSGSKKAINLTMNKPYVYGANEDGKGNQGGEPRYKFSIVNKPSSVRLKDDVRGVIIYNAPAGGGDTTIEVKASTLDLSGNSIAETQPFSITFKAVDSSTVTLVPVQPVNKTIDNFEKLPDTDVDKYNVKDPKGLIWADRNDNTPDPVTETMSYKSAEEYCVGFGNGWRIPTKDELLDLVDYGNTENNSSKPIIPTSTEASKGFKIGLMNVWAKKENGREIYFSENTGVFVYKDNDQKLPVRCVKGVEEDTKHIVYSDTLEYTYDENTGLEWTPALPAGTDCTTFKSQHIPTPHNGYKSPTINELRSIVENGSVSYFLTEGQTSLMSSTPYYDTTNVWMLELNKNGFSNMTTIGAGTVSITDKVVCVKPK